VGFVVDKVALGQVFLRVLRFSPVTIIPPLLHIHLSPPHQVSDRSDQAAHYHNLGPKLGASFLAQNFCWKQNKKVKKISEIPQEILNMLPPALLPIRRKVCCGFLLPLNIYPLGRV
jgi:hypothetical protein